MIDFSAFADEMEKIAISPELKARAAGEAQRRMDGANRLMRTPAHMMSEHQRTGAEKQYSRAARQLPAFQGHAPTNYTVRKAVDQSQQQASAAKLQKMDATSAGRKGARTPPAPAAPAINPAAGTVFKNPAQPAPVSSTAATVRRPAAPAGAAPVPAAHPVAPKAAPAAAGLGRRAAGFAGRAGKFLAGAGLGRGAALVGLGVAGTMGASALSGGGQ